MKNIGFGKVGKSIKFRTNKYSPIGGDNEASCILRSLANNNPSKTFYIIGRSDYGSLSNSEKAKLFPYDNVVDVWKGVDLSTNSDYYQHIIRYFEKKEFELDYTFMMVGQLGSVTIPDKILKVRDTDSENPISSVLDMTKWYATPITTWLNEKKPRYAELINDPRYTMRQPRDVWHMPEKSFSQYDYEYTKKHIQSYKEQTSKYSTAKPFYCGLETAFCYDYDFSESVNEQRSTDFMIVLNEGKPSRYGVLKEWVLDRFETVDIYGKWSDSVGDDRRFKGPAHITEIQKMMSDVKFTFIIPIAPGWVTSKYIEMIHAGVIPFLHPSYDEQRHLDIPDILRPKTPKEFYQTMDDLLSNDKKWIDLLRDLRNRILRPEYYDGRFLSDTLLGRVEENYKRDDLSKYTKQDKIGLEGWF